MQLKRPRHVPHVYAPVLDQHPHDIEPVALPYTSMPVYPCLSRFREFTLFSPMNGFDRITEFISVARFHFDERDESVTFGDDVDIPAPRAKTPRENFPAGFFQPAHRDALTKFAEGVGLSSHATNVRARGDDYVTKVSRSETKLRRRSGGAKRRRRNLD
jgi:hypothetical protein